MIQRNDDPEWMSSLLDCFPIAAMIVDADGGIRAENRLAQECNRAGLKLESGRASRRDSHHSHLRELIAATDASCGGPVTLTVPRSDNGSSWLVRVKYLGGEAEAGSYLVSWLDPRSSPATDWDLVESVYRLSRAERKVATLLANGDDLATAARKLGIQHDTARSHLKSIFRKMGVHRQQELVRIAAMLSFIC